MKHLTQTLMILCIVATSVFAKFCPECGVNCEDDANFCIECGRALNEKNIQEGAIDLTDTSPVLQEECPIQESGHIGQWIPGQEDETVNTAPRDGIINSVVIVHTAHPNNRRGQATAFLADFNGEAYLVTNQHVLDSATGIRLVTLDGDILKPLTYEFALSQDLVRIKVDCGDFEYTPIPVSFSRPQIGDAITAYGNSEGQSTINTLHGEVMGVGNAELEISATIVHGNSGGPIVNDRGEVICVSTRGYKSQPAWTNADTRFARTRRFGERLLEDTEWKELPIKAFCEQSHFLCDMEFLFIDLFPIATGDHTGINIFETDLVRTRYYNKAWHTLLNDIVSKYMKPDRYGKIHEVILHNSEMFDALQHLVSERGEFLRQAKWLTKQLHEKAELLYEFQQFLHAGLESEKRNVNAKNRATAAQRLSELEQKVADLQQQIGSVDDQIALTKATMEQVRAEWHRSKSLNALDPQLKPYRKILSRLYAQKIEIKKEADPYVKELNAIKKELGI